MQAITRTLCNAKVRIGKHGTLAPTYIGLKKEFRTTNKSMIYGFAMTTSDIVLVARRKKKKM